MIRKLRKKFVLINMLLVSAVLLVVFSASFVSNYRQLQMDSIGAMKQAIGRKHDEPPFKLELKEGEEEGGRSPDRRFFSIPVFVAELDQGGQVLLVRGDAVSSSDATVQSLVEQALAAGDRQGVLPAYDLRFLVEDLPEGTRVAFADRGSERELLAGLLLTSVGAFAAAIAAFFAVSLFLARWALHPVEEAWRRQQQFVADASHELKTPLTVILANAGILLAHQGDTVGQQVKWVENTQAEAVRMKKLVDDLLFLAKSDAARSPLTPVSLNLSDAVWSTVLPFESLAFEHGMVLDIDIMPALTCLGNEGQLKQLTAILLDNACKYADDGGKVQVRLSAAADRLLLEVSNSGAPIPAEDLSHLFERFYRADKSRAREQGGYGLGLAIAKSIVDAHGGTISVQSDKRLTHFMVSLPLNVPTATHLRPRLFRFKRL